MTSSLPGYDQWLQRGADDAFGGEHPMGYPIVCSYCGEHEYGKDVEDKISVAHCTDEDTSEVLGWWQTDWDFDWRDADPRIP